MKSERTRVNLKTKQKFDNLIGEFGEKCDNYFSKIMPWGDNDNAVIDNWEDLDEEADFDEQFDLILKNKKQPTTKLKSNEFEEDNDPDKGDREIRVVMLGDDAYRTQYVPKAPVLKILKRPSPEHAHGAGQSDDLGLKTKPVPKTLQQREQEYAEARLRIWGLQNHCSDEHFLSHNNGSKKNELSNSKDDEHPVQIIRLPRGPDGTQGFKHPRS